MGVSCIVCLRGVLLRQLLLVFLSLLLLDLFRSCHAAAITDTPWHSLPRDAASRSDGLAPALPLTRRQSANSTYPTAFDSSIGNNFTEQTCPNFFKTFLNDPSFVACHPVSMMLQTSYSFFQALKSQVLLTRTLDAACSADVSICAPLMSTYATKLMSQCANDYSLGNPLVTMAYAGFQAYSPLYEATCLRQQTGNAQRTSNSTSSSSPTESGYCFASAATNSSDPTGFYVYYLPLGVALPGGATTGCTWCLQQTMNGFSKYASNTKQLLSTTYKDAATLLNEVCGPSWVEANVQPAKSAAHAHSVSLRPLLATLSAILLLLQ